MVLENSEINNKFNESTTDLLKENLKTQNKEVFSFFNFSKNNIDIFDKRQDIFNKLGLNF